MAFALSARAGAAKGAARPEHARRALAGQLWLCEHQNDDGGWGDTTDSPSNISTTTLCWASLGVVQDPEPRVLAAIRLAEGWLTKACGGTLAPRALAKTIRTRYGKDHTFSVPILTTCALAGRLGEEGWSLVPSLPFELAALPHQLFKWLRLQTVSYALPALIAIGQVRHHHLQSRNPIARKLREWTKDRTLRLLGRIQPASGGFLEAAPLTSFVSMSLIAMELDEHPVTVFALGFLSDTVRDDGSWPIDTNLDTWLTTLSVNALGGEVPDRSKTLSWLLDQQYKEVHPYTRAAPGGWAWTDLTGGVPDADDTAGALLALHRVSEIEGRPPGIREAAMRGITWLLNLQNRNGGIPTFCRGWGRLPFDRSSPDLTAHALRAFCAWRDEVPEVRERLDRAMRAGVAYLIKTQRSGAWVPLWFGNQYELKEENPLYGTTRVLRAIAAARGRVENDWVPAGRRAVEWILAAQAPDGGFGGGPGVRSSIEETALALEALCEWARLLGEVGTLRGAIEKAASWLIDKTGRGTRFDASPIGLYFARLWYSERLYPVIFTASALESARRCLALPGAAVPSA